MRHRAGFFTVSPHARDLSEAGGVDRAGHRYTGLDVSGSRIEREVEDCHARVARHECDHLDGALYPSRIRDMPTFGFDEALAAEA